MTDQEAVALIQHLRTSQSYNSYTLPGSAKQVTLTEFLDWVEGLRSKLVALAVKLAEEH